MCHQSDACHNNRAPAVGHVNQAAAKCRREAPALDSRAPPPHPTPPPVPAVAELLPHLTSAVSSAEAGA